MLREQILLRRATVLSRSSSPLRSTLQRQVRLPAESLFQIPQGEFHRGKVKFKTARE
jgi:hypothetical protein